MASGVFNKGKYILVSGDVDWDGATDVRVLLTTASYTPSVDHNFVSDVTNELSGGNYVRKATASRTLTEDDTNDLAKLDMADIVWTALQAAAGTPRYAVVYKYNASDAAAELICWNDLGGTVIPNGGDVTVAWAAAGVATLT